MSDHIFKLKDGRNLGYAEYGDPNGTPLFYFHGWPSSRFDGIRIDNVAKTLNIRVIATDRPGIGISDYKEDRTLLDFAYDIEELADKLGFQKFSVMGVSGGGPYSAVCAYKLPNRVTASAIVVGLAPTYIKNICNVMAWPNRLSWSNYHRFPILRILAGYSVFFQAKLGSLDLSKPFLSELDKKLKRNIRYKSLLEQDRNGAIQQGPKGIIKDLEIYTTPWGFDVKNIKVPVHLWYGKDDKNVSINMGKYYKQQIPNRTLTVYEGGHFSWIEHTEEILKTLVT